MIFVFVGAAATLAWLDVWTASLRRFMRLPLGPNCAAAPRPEMDAFDDSEGYRLLVELV